MITVVDEVSTKRPQRHERVFGSLDGLTQAWIIGGRILVLNTQTFHWTGCSFDALDTELWRKVNTGGSGVAGPITAKKNYAIAPCTCSWCQKPIRIGEQVTIVTVKDEYNGQSTRPDEFKGN